MNNYDELFENQGVSNPSDPLSKEDYAAMKKAERDDLFILSDNTALEVAGDGDRFQQYLDVQSKFDRYSAVNALLILAQKPESTRLADFDRWKSLGGFVKPGQTAISILEPHEYTKEDGTPGTGYNVKKVFDISQVDARKIKPNLPHAYTERQLLAALISKAPMTITVTNELSDNLRALTDFETGEILVRRGMEFNDTFRSIAQELASVERCDDCKNPQFIGYCASYILCKKYGVNIQGYSFERVLIVFNNKEPHEIKAELLQIRDVVADISGRMAKQLGPVQKSEKTQESRDTM